MHLHEQPKGYSESLFCVARPVLPAQLASDSAAPSQGDAALFQLPCCLIRYMFITLQFLQVPKVEEERPPGTEDDPEIEGNAAEPAAEQDAAAAAAAEAAVAAAHQLLAPQQPRLQYALNV